MTGELFLSGKIYSNNQVINITQLTPGNYIVSIFNKIGEKINSRKIVKQKSECTSQLNQLKYLLIKQ
jgi:hypothetical protein